MLLPKDLLVTATPVQRKGSLIVRLVGTAIALEQRITVNLHQMLLKLLDIVESLIAGRTVSSLLLLLTLRTVLTPVDSFIPVKAINVRIKTLLGAEELVAAFHGTWTILTMNANMLFKGSLQVGLVGANFALEGGLLVEGDHVGVVEGSVGEDEATDVAAIGGVLLGDVRREDWRE